MTDKMVVLFGMPVPEIDMPVRVAVMVRPELVAVAFELMVN